MSTARARRGWWVLALLLGGCAKGESPAAITMSPEHEDAGADARRPDARSAADVPTPPPEPDGGEPARPDCYPPCIANLRRRCRREVPTDGGVCSVQLVDGVENYCFPNGVRELRHYVGDAGHDITALFTYPDGKTPCYRVDVIDMNNDIIYRTVDGQEVARLSFGGGGRTISCDGRSYTLTAQMANDPACRDGNEGDCHPGSCQ